MQIAKTESIVYRTILKLLEGALKEISPSSKKEEKGSKRIRGVRTKWKCSEYVVPIYKARSNYWKRAYRRLFN
jgi:hypothetical protein